LYTQISFWDEEGVEGVIGDVGSMGCARGTPIENGLIANGDDMAHAIHIQSWDKMKLDSIQFRITSAA
jgi:hypothetical protein